jgi:hypothetical protein
MVLGKTSTSNSPTYPKEKNRGQKEVVRAKERDVNHNKINT